MPSVSYDPSARIRRSNFSVASKSAGEGGSNDKGGVTPR